MKNIRIASLDSVQSFQLVQDQVLSIDVKTLEIHANHGTVWVTWPNGNDCVLSQGQTIKVQSKGVICVQAMSACVVLVRGQKIRNPFSINGYHRRPIHKFAAPIG